MFENLLKINGNLQINFQKSSGKGAASEGSSCQSNQKRTFEKNAFTRKETRLRLRVCICCGLYVLQSCMQCFGCS